MSLLKWAQNSIGMGKSSNSNSSSLSSPANSASKTNGNNNVNGSSIGVKWVHSSETLQKQGVVYVVKFLGNLIVEQTNGIDVVKEAIRKLEFSRQLRKSEAGSSATKLKKVELHVSIDRVAIQELKSHHVLHQYPLHRISYCADDKGEKNFFAFIAKNQSTSSNNKANDNDTIDTKAKSDTKVTASADSTHEIFVFISDKLAEEITVTIVQLLVNFAQKKTTIGQAFDLAYKKFLESSGNEELNIQRRLLIAQQRIQRLELENNIFKQRLLDLSHLKGVSNYMNQLQLKSIIEVPKTHLSKPLPASSLSSALTFAADNATNGNLIDTKSDDNKNTIVDNQQNCVSSKESLVSLAFPVSVKSNDFGYNSVSGNMTSSSLVDNDDDFDPRFYEKNADHNDNHNHNNITPLLAPPPSSSKTSKRALTSFSEISTTNNTNSSKVDIFGMHNFQTNQIENPITLFDNEILEMEKAFSRGLSLGTEDFSLESLDPLRN